ncbi:fibroblast growth factor 22 isoform X2 [Marmota marmota marmota]|uniref:fibroblast growth factor 22 isoform X2 n=1 Tax=Marmota marmota marmota TaxID=9994 RepID=UPI0020927995|nr:fibroblast growth factor 22 isoform X2 [Marmota marmota marmota]
MRRRLWLGLAWLLLARAPSAAGTPSAPRRPRSYPHLEGDVRWRRLFSSTQFFLRVDPGGRVLGTRWRHGQDSVVEIRSVHVGTVAIKAVHSGFYVAMSRQGHLYGSTAGSWSASRRTATTPTPHSAGATGAGPCSWHWTDGGLPGKACAHGGITCPPTSCPSWSPEAL